MGIRIALHHRTRYQYEKAVLLGPQVIQLRPTPHCHTPILNYSLKIAPADHLLNWQLDPHANYLARVLFPSKTAEFAVDVELVADLTPINPFDFVLEPGFETFPFTYPPQLAKDLEPYRSPAPPGPLLRMFLANTPRTSQSTVAFLVDLNCKVRDEVGYRVRMENGVQSTEETLMLRSGSCRDSAWLLVETCRHLGIAARFVSGYLVQLVPEKPALEGSDTPRVDSADLHAWAEVYLPGAGWIGMDPTSGLFASEGHIPLVCTPRAGQAAPIGGTVEPAESTFEFNMSVRRLDEVPSLLKPFTDQQWNKVRDVAHFIDHELKENDVRLTMGGEPTYVGIDDTESGQWNLEALGPLKRTLGLSLIRSLRQRTAPGGLLHFGQGKWYPGEPLPRWAYHCISRMDGVPVWENADLFALESEDYRFGIVDAKNFIQALTRRLGASSENILAAFNRDSDETVDPEGFVLPLRRRQPEGRLTWSSQLWFPKPDRLLLSPGDSPIGYRIPVEAMPWVAPDQLVYEYEPEPNAERVQLPAAPARLSHLFEVEAGRDPLPPLSSTAETATELIRPSLCVQVREGRLHVFLPYVSVVADYLDLVAAIEDTCAYLNNAIWLEGYTPPHDLRLRSFSLTPDPGVLEVNLPPTSDWDELEQLNEILAEEAGKKQLIAAKFAYDGTHLATGGGSHIVIGGASVLDSPILRRPDLLRSMVGFWQNHPALSYLFAGMYVGPTSQYPRVDEARPDALYELEVSFSQLPSLLTQPGGCPPWILDGLFRNLLVDVTGNTHRAEFCIDKLFPPEGTGLRIGLLELRAFEMAPHVRMGLMAMLLVRALVLMLWKKPFSGSLLRWGTALHDRFMLPHFIRLDMAEVVSELRRAGYDFEMDWFAAQMEFRFPKIGSMSADGVEMELRQALEPWNVLAEEATSGGMGRSVDSSLERIQVKLNSVGTEGRYVVTCNERIVPLHPTGQPGESVAGIRYRARKLSAALHPTIPVHTPLTFDLIDLWHQRTVGRCTYYAGKPDGTLYSGRPTNAREARERRAARFVISPAPAFPAKLPLAESNPSFPMTLDLRWPAPEQPPSSEKSDGRE